MGIDQQAAAVGGTVAPGFEGVRDAFARNFVEHGEVGAACALYVDGRPVVDLWGGVADAATGAPYLADTLQLVFSSTKGLTAICANLLAERGELDVDAPVAEYWPEFAQAGKEDVPVRWLLCHKGGLPYVVTPTGLDDALAWDPVVDALAGQTPEWEPGTAHGYHAVTYGWLVGEVIRRVSGRRVGTFFGDEIAGPLGLEAWIGLPDELQSRVAPLTTRALGPGAGRDDGAGMEVEEPQTLTEFIEEFLGPDSLLAKALGGTIDPVTGEGVFTGDGVFNRPEVRAAELPAANGVATARSLAKLYAATIGGVEGGPSTPLLSPDQVAAASTTQTEGADRVLMFPTTFGLGFMTSSPFSPYGGPKGFGHAGAGGSVAFADPEAGVGFAYVMNRMMANLTGDPRSQGLVNAAYEALGITPTFA
ncbi:MAG TPA: serine hydrolase domain-containing protein [Acidimicrobiales bacterium]|nr:serine hydrolase domain-containing protein [Acidimicrobiales bacterium]